MKKSVKCSKPKLNLNLRPKKTKETETKANKLLA